MLSDREAGKEDSHFASDANGDDAKMLLLSPPTQIDGGPTNEQRLLLSSSPAVRLRHPGADESISSSPSRRPAGAGAEQRASYGGRPPAVGVSAMCMAGGPAQVWSSEPAAVARRDGGSMELRLRRRSPPALSLSLSTSGSVEAAALEDGEPGRPWSSHPSRREQRQRRRSARARSRGRNCRRPSAGGVEILFALDVGDNQKCVSKSSTVEDANEGMQMKECMYMFSFP
jgi:hypothetical protein